MNPFLKASVAAALVFAQIPAAVATPDVSPASANQAWDRLSRTFSPEDVSVSRGGSGWLIDFGIGPELSENGSTGALIPAFVGIRFTKPFAQPTEIFNACPIKPYAFERMGAEGLKGFIEDARKGGRSCDAASGLRALYLADLAAFEKIEGWTLLLQVLADAGALRDFNVEMSQLLLYKNPRPETLEDLRFLQLKAYANLVPDRHVNPRGTLPKINFASEFEALIQLFRSSYPASSHLDEVKAIESRLFNDYVLTYDIPILPLVLKSQSASNVVVQGQKAFTPLDIALDYPKTIWAADAETIDRILGGKESIYHATCGCSLQETMASKLEDVAEVDGLGYSRVMSLERAQNTCVRLAREASKTKRGTAYTHSCTQVETPLSESLVAELKQAYEQAVAQDQFWDVQSGRLVPTYKKVFAGALTLLFSSFTWRNRGGGPYKLSGTQQARILFALIPQTLLGATFGYLADGWDGAKTGAIAGALMTPALMIPWGRQMDVGHLNGNKWEDFALLNLRGMLQTLPAAYYLHSQGKDPAPVLLGGLSMGPCYLASWQWGSEVKVAKNWGSGLVDGPTAWGELCWGGALGLGLMKSLNSDY